MKAIEWGYPIVLYLFLGGLSAGLFFVSALAHLSHERTYQSIARFGALWAPWPVGGGCLLLVFDLGHWHRFWKLFVHFQYTSPMSIGSWLLAAFSVMSLLYLFSWLTASERDRLFARIPRRLAFLGKLNRDLAPWRTRLAVLGLPCSLGVGIYTGVLLGAVQSRPFWNTSLVAQLFLFSALSAGCAAIMLGLVWKREQAEPAAFRALYVVDAVLLVLELFIIIPYVIHGELSVHAVKEAMHLILGGPFTILFWVFFVGAGVALPLVLELAEVFAVVRAESHRIAAVSAVLVLSGGLLLRYIFVFAGQMSTFVE